MSVEDHTIRHEESYKMFPLEGCLIGQFYTVDHIGIFPRLFFVSINDDFCHGSGCFHSDLIIRLHASYHCLLANSLAKLKNTYALPDGFLIEIVTRYNAYRLKCLKNIKICN